MEVRLLSKKYFYNMDKIDKILNFKHGDSSLMKSIRASLIVEHFNKLISEEWGRSMINHVNGVSYKEKTLTVACMSAVAANEVKLKEGLLVRKMNLEFGDSTVTDVKYML